MRQHWYSYILDCLGQLPGCCSPVELQVFLSKKKEPAKALILGCTAVLWGFWGFCIPLSSQHYSTATTVARGWGPLLVTGEQVPPDPAALFPEAQPGNPQSLSAAVTWRSTVATSKFSLTLTWASRTSLNIEPSRLSCSILLSNAKASVLPNPMDGNSSRQGDTNLGIFFRLFEAKWQCSHLDNNNIFKELGSDLMNVSLMY